MKQIHKNGVLVVSNGQSECEERCACCGVKFILTEEMYDALNEVFDNSGLDLSCVALVCSDDCMEMLEPECPQCGWPETAEGRIPCMDHFSDGDDGASLLMNH